MYPVIWGISWMTTGLRMSEPILLVGIGILLALSLVFSARWFRRSRVGRRTIRRLETVAPKLMSDIEADMGQLHAQIAVATRRLETSVEQMKSKTTSQLSEIAKSSEIIARLKAEHGERALALEALEAKGRTIAEQLRTTEAHLAVKTGALEELERKLAEEKAELKDLMAFIDARDKLAEADSRHAAAMDGLRSEKIQVEEQLARSREECAALKQEMQSLKKQVESTWASERIANALLRERINDVAGEVVRVAHALEGLGSPIDTMLAGKVAELDAAASANGEAFANNLSKPPAGDDSKGMLAHRIRSLQKRAARVASSGGP
jgi:chromosome segregation ATPase